MRNWPTQMLPMEPRVSLKIPPLLTEKQLAAWNTLSVGSGGRAQLPFAKKEGDFYYSVKGDRDDRPASMTKRP